MMTPALKWPLTFFARSSGSMSYLVIIAWCAIVLGSAFRFVALPTRAVYLDEAVTQIRVAGHTAAELMRTIYDGRQRTAQELRQASTVGPQSSAKLLIASLSKEDAQHPPLFYLAELFIVRTFGNSLLIWRVLPAVFGILAIPAAYSLAHELFSDRRAGLLAAALFAVSPIERIYSEQAREYSLLTLLVLLSTLAVVRGVRRNTVGPWALYAALAIAGLYTSPFMAYVMVAHTAFVLVVGRKTTRTIVAFAAASAAAVIAYLPWLYQIVVHRRDIAATNEWSAAKWPFARLAAKWAFNTASSFFDLEYIDMRWLIVLAVVAVIAAIAVVRGFRAADPPERWCLGVSIVIPALLLVAPDVLLGEHRSSVARYGLPIFAMMLIVAARGLVGRPAAATVLLAAGLFSSAAGVSHSSWWDNDTNADDAQIAAAITRVPHAQVVSTVAPPEFATFARVLGDDVRVSLTPRIAEAQFSATDPVFVLQPSAADLLALQKRTGLRFVPVTYERTLTAHEMGARIANKGKAEAGASDLYQAVR